MRNLTASVRKCVEHILKSKSSDPGLTPILIIVYVVDTLVQRARSSLEFSVLGSVDTCWHIHCYFESA